MAVEADVAAGSNDGASVGAGAVGAGAAKRSTSASLGVTDDVRDWGLWVSLVRDKNLAGADLARRCLGLFKGSTRTCRISENVFFT